MGKHRVHMTFVMRDGSGSGIAKVKSEEWEILESTTDELDGVEQKLIHEYRVWKEEQEQYEYRNPVEEGNDDDKEQS